jgi:hypothetical protein
MENIVTSGQVASTASLLINERETWENTLYKQSNDALYDLLAKAYHLFKQIKGTRSLIKALNQQLDALGITYNAKTSLATKIARLVFGDCGNRVFAFASVFNEADRQNIEPTKLKNWITSQNGIENIRKSTGAATPSAAELAKQGAEFCSSIDALFAIDKRHQDLEPHPEAENEFSVALVRPAGDGKFEVVFGSNKKSIVNTVLSEAGRLYSAVENSKQILADVKQTQKAVHDAVQSANSGA